MMDWISAHWIEIFVGLVLLYGVRKIFKTRAEKRRLEAWEKERKRLREIEDRRLHQEREDRAQKAAEQSTVCRTEEQVAEALESGAEKIILEGALANHFRKEESVLVELRAAYRVGVARHGKVILSQKAAEPA